MNATLTAKRPDSAADEAVILHEIGAQRFSRAVEGELCVLNYRLNEAGNTVSFHHTGVPDALQGRGLAAALVEVGLEWARDERLTVVPACSYVRAFLSRHPEYQALVAR